MTARPLFWNGNNASTQARLAVVEAFKPGATSAY
jgi:hypothetical protein